MATIAERIERLEAELKQLKSDAMQPAGYGELLTIDEARKLPINTPILYADDLKSCAWVTGHFGGVTKGGEFLMFGYGRTLFSNDGNPATVRYRFAKRDYTAPSIINWIPNTGTQPTLKEGQKTIGRLRNGTISNTLTRWTLTGEVYDIIEYAIIE